MSDISQVNDNLATFDKAAPLSEREQDLIHCAAQIQQSDVAVACTSCRYCCDDCPVGLDIPKLLSFYNDFKLDDKWRLAGINALPKDKQPSACIGCGSCTRHCPQGLDTPRYMAEMAAAM